MFQGDYSIIDSLNVIPYYMSKTRSRRTDVYFNGDKSKGRMGGLYTVQVIVLDEKMVNKFFNYEFYHLVVDDESSYCLPFVDSGPNWFVYLLFWNVYFYFIILFSIPHNALK